MLDVGYRFCTPEEITFLYKTLSNFLNLQELLFSAVSKERVCNSCAMCISHTISLGWMVYCETVRNERCTAVKVKKQSLYTPWRRLGGEEV
jgi:hypothetical protein